MSNENPNEYKIINKYEFQIIQNSKRIEELKKDIRKLKGEKEMSKKLKQTNSRYWSQKPGKIDRVIYNEIITNSERRDYAKQMLHMDAQTYWLKYRNEQLEQQIAEERQMREVYEQLLNESQLEIESLEKSGFGSFLVATTALGASVIMAIVFSFLSL